MATINGEILELLENMNDTLMESQVKKFAKFATSLHPLIQEMQSLDCWQSRILTHAQHAEGLAHIRNAQRGLDKCQQMWELAANEESLMSEDQKLKLYNSLNSEQH